MTPTLLPVTVFDFDGCVIETCGNLQLCLKKRCSGFLKGPSLPDPCLQAHPAAPGLFAVSCKSGWNEQRGQADIDLWSMEDKNKLAFHIEGL